MAAARAGGTSGPTGDPARALAELSVIVDTIDGLRQRVGAIAEPFLGSEREDVVTTVHEAERQLLIAVRTIQRAMKTLDR